MAQALFQHCSTGCNRVRMCTVPSFGEKVKEEDAMMTTDGVGVGAAVERVLIDDAECCLLKDRVHGFGGGIRNQVH